MFFLIIRFVGPLINRNNLSLTDYNARMENLGREFRGKIHIFAGWGLFKEKPGNDNGYINMFICCLNSPCPYYKQIIRTET